MKVALLALALVAGCGHTASGPAADGKQVFLTVGCTRCHGPTGKPSADLVARMNVQDLTAPSFRARVTPELVAHQVQNGSKNHIMPAFAGALTEDQIQAVAQFVASPAFLTLGK